MALHSTQTYRTTSEGYIVCRTAPGDAADPGSGSADDADKHVDAAGDGGDGAAHVAGDGSDDNADDVDDVSSKMSPHSGLGC